MEIGKNTSVAEIMIDTIITDKKDVDIDVLVVLFVELFGFICLITIQTI